MNVINERVYVLYNAQLLYTSFTFHDYIASLNSVKKEGHHNAHDGFFYFLLLLLSSSLLFLVCLFYLPSALLRSVVYLLLC